ncbi:helix-turn-helix transcriptional regulator [Actinocorallia longicatena]|uniref:Helix-turn-helix transcriptional regulator n=1 Tax=Actinocorallia longicatena TaxID=111803 RepID=A0ABP6Q4W8_9ACTN
MARPPKPLDPGSSGLALFGAALRNARMAVGETLAGLGVKINYSTSTIGDVERGESRCERDLAERSDEQLNTGGMLALLWDHLVKDSLYRPWFVKWPGIEEKATLIRTFQPLLIHGLLQTEEYARALLYGNENDVAARMLRQSILTRGNPAPPFLVVVIDEGVLWRQVGEPKVMHSQLMHLVTSVSDRLSVQVVPSGVVHPGNVGAFVMATLEDRSEVVYREAAPNGIISSSKDDLVKLNESFEVIRGKALPVDMSLDLIRRTAEEKWT